MYLKMHTNFDEQHRATNSFNKSDKMKFLNQSANGDAESLASSSAFDGQLARLGGFESLRQEVDEDQVKEDESDEDAGEEGNEDADETEDGARGAKGKPKKTDDGDKEWFGRKVKIFEAVKAENAKHAAQLKTLRDTHEKLYKIITLVNKDTTGVKTEFQAEYDDGSVRLKALKLVLGIEDGLVVPPVTENAAKAKTGETDGQVTEGNMAELQKELQLVENARKLVQEALDAAEALDKKIAEAIPEMLETKKNEIKEFGKPEVADVALVADCQVEAKQQFHAEVAEMEEKQRKRDEANALLAEHTARKADAKTKAEETAAAGKASDGAGAGGTAIVVDGSPEGKHRDVDEQSSLHDVEAGMKLKIKALRRFIATFTGIGSEESPPCRSWKSLIVESEITEYFQKMKRAKNPATCA